MVKGISYVCLLVAISSLFSCAHLFQSHARVVKKQPGKGGVLAIPNGFDGGANARIEAENMMSANCSGKYEITEEGETVVGQKGTATQSTRENQGGFFTSTSQVDTSTRDLTEWRLTYKCN